MEFPAEWRLMVLYNNLKKKGSDPSKRREVTQVTAVYYSSIKSEVK